MLLLSRSEQIQVNRFYYQFIKIEASTYIVMTVRAAAKLRETLILITSYDATFH